MRGLTVRSVDDFAGRSGCVGTHGLLEGIEAAVRVAAAGAPPAGLPALDYQAEELET